MSLIFGIIDNKTENIPDSLEKMFNGISHVPYESLKTKTVSEAGFGHLLTYNTPEAVFENQPVYLSEQQLLITSEARLDNRDALARQLEIRLHSRIPDGELIRHAYLKWQKKCVSYLIGDWSFAVYDIQKQELFLARDQQGYTSIYYFYDGKQFAFASSAKSIFSLSRFTKKINIRHFLGGLLLWQPDDKNLQAYENLHIVPPAHTLSFKDGKITTARYWFPENIQERNYKNTDDYAEELREILMEAVRVRLRSYKSVASTLSGGLDSGSVSAMAAHLLKEKGQSLTTFSHVPLFKEELSLEKESNRLLDETGNILAVVNHCGNIRSRLLDSSNVSPTEGFIRAMSIYDTHFHAACNAFWLIDLPGQAAKEGFSTLLTGEMGNATISFGGVRYQLPWYHPSLIFEPEKLIRLIARALMLKYNPSYYEQRDGSLNIYISNSYIHKRILDEWGVLEDIREKSKGFSKYYPNAKAGMLDILNIGANPRCQIGHINTNEFGLEYRDPTADINVIEFCLSIPNYAFFDNRGNNKIILKKMMKGYLPHSVLHATKKGLQASDIKYRLLQNKDSVNELLSVFRSSPHVKDLINVEKLVDDWKDFTKISTKAANEFLKGLMYSYFWHSNQ